MAAQRGPDPPDDLFLASDHCMSLILDMLPGFVWTAGADGELEYLSRSILDYTGMTAEALKADWYSAVHPDDVESRDRGIETMLQSGEPLEGELRVRRYDGVYRWFQCRTRALCGDHGRIIRWYGLLTDIDDGRRMSDALRSAQDILSRAAQSAAVAEMSASIAHEINQPLAAVVANAHACQLWLSGDAPNLAKAQSILEKIVRDGNSAADVVGRIRALFTQTPPALAPLDVGEVIVEVLHLMRDEALSADVKVETVIEKNLPLIAADRVQLQQLLVNLVRNAIEAMTEATHRSHYVSIRSRRERRTVLVEISDRGPGLDSVERVFEPFFTTKRHGMGMGLAICRSIVEAHNGRLWARCNDEEGTTFSVALPVCASDAV